MRQVPLGREAGNQKLNYAHFAGLCVGLIASLPAQAQFKIGSVINASGTPQGTVFLTFDDGLDEAGPDGDSETEKVARYLHGPVSFPSSAHADPSQGVNDLEKSIRATFAVVTCHLLGQDLADPNSSLCHGYGDRPESVAAEVVQLGHDLMNHSVNHIPLTLVESDPAKILYEVGRAQTELDKIQGNSPRLFRGPGLAFDDTVAGILNADSYTGKLIGPIDTDVGGDFYAGSWMGGDWDCFAEGMTPKACGDLYVNAIRSASHGVIVLLHVRTEIMSGTDGNPFALKLIKYIVQELGPGYTYLPLDAIPGVLGQTKSSPVQHVSNNFGTSDGQGQVAAGALAGSGQPAGVCKARTGVIYCQLADGKGGFLPATPWLTITDQTWFLTYGSQFWLTDINGDGLADLVFPGASSLWVAANGGHGAFRVPVLYYSGTVPDPRFIRFGRVNGDPLADMVVWTPQDSSPQIFVNTGVRFAPPENVSGPGIAPVERLLETLQLIDMNGDGRDDLVIKAGTHVRCALNTGSGFGPFQACSTVGGQFSDAQGWSDPAYASTFAIANINGPVLVGGLPTGVIFAPVSYNDGALTVSDRYRFVCNDCFTNHPDASWRPELRASQIVWADFEGKGMDSPCFVRNDGLYLGLTQIAE
jgi:hypothetical protein